MSIATKRSLSVEEASRLQAKLVKAVVKENDERAIDILNFLDSVSSVEIEVLSATNIGKTVGKLRKNTSTEITTKAKALVAKWKESVKASMDDIGKTVGKLRKNTSTEITTKAKALVAKWKESVKAAMEATEESARKIAPTKTTHQGTSAPGIAWTSSGQELDFSLSIEDFLTQELSELPPSPVLVYRGQAEVDPRRVRPMNAAARGGGGGGEGAAAVAAGGGGGPGPVAYWMQRDQRARDNHALLHAQELAERAGAPLVVLFNLVPSFLDATARQFHFMLRGLRQVEMDLVALGIGFRVLLGAPEDTVPEFVREHSVKALVCDFSPLRISVGWKKAVAKKLEGTAIPMYEVDAHNIAPCWHVSDKCEFGAKTIRGKIHRAMPEFLVELKELTSHSIAWEHNEPVDWAGCLKSLNINNDIPEVTWLTSGERSAFKMLETFLPKLGRYDEDRNNPNLRGAVSNLAPYLHFGQVAAQRVALEVKRRTAQSISRLFTNDRTTGPQAFLEELVVRKELSDNYCLYNPDYDNIDGAHAWARKEIEAHRGDRRERVWGRAALEAARSHEDLWNAAQLELVQRGKLHGYMRMYWAKKILEWTATPEEGLATAIYLNDKYSLDGRDPSGYVGCMWAICGVHDRAWTSRPVFGKIRYMNYNGCKRKFDVGGYIAKNRRIQASGPQGSVASKKIK